MGSNLIKLPVGSPSPGDSDTSTRRRSRGYSLGTRIGASTQGAAADSLGNSSWTVAAGVRGTGKRLATRRSRSSSATIGLKGPRKATQPSFNKDTQSVFADAPRDRSDWVPEWYRSQKTVLSGRNSPSKNEIITPDPEKQFFETLTKRVREGKISLPTHKMPLGRNSAEAYVRAYNATRRGGSAMNIARKRLSSGGPTIVLNSKPPFPGRKTLDDVARRGPVISGRFSKTGLTSSGLDPMSPEKMAPNWQQKSASTFDDLMASRKSESSLKTAATNARPGSRFASQGLAGDYNQAAVAPHASAPRTIAGEAANSHGSLSPVPDGHMRTSACVRDRARLSQTGNKYAGSIPPHRTTSPRPKATSPPSPGPHNDLLELQRHYNRARTSNQHATHAAGVYATHRPRPPSETHYDGGVRLTRSGRSSRSGSPDQHHAESLHPQEIASSKDSTSRSKRSSLGATGPGLQESISGDRTLEGAGGGATGPGYYRRHSLREAAQDVILADDARQLTGDKFGYERDGNSPTRRRSASPTGVASDNFSLPGSGGVIGSGRKSPRRQQQTIPDSSNLNTSWTSITQGLGVDRRDSGPPSKRRRTAPPRVTPPTSLDVGRPKSPLAKAWNDQTEHLIDRELFLHSLHPSPTGTAGKLGTIAAIT